MKLEKILVECTKPQVWDVGNETLYRLCAERPNHTDLGEIVSKVWIIGRTYAAAIERRKYRKESKNDDFYRTVVGKHIKNAQVDSWIHFDPTDWEDDAIVKAHGKLTCLFKNISGLNKRSLASKYLHFHNPDLVYIYDSRAKLGLKRLTKELGLKMAKPSHLNGCDDEYHQFYVQCQQVITELAKENSISLSPRQLDNALIMIADRL